MLALCDRNVNRISSFRDFETLFENVKTKVEEVLPAVLAVMKEKNEEVKAVLNRRDSSQGFPRLRWLKKRRLRVGSFCKFLKREYSQDAWAHITNRSTNDKKYHLTAFLEDECEKLETIPDGDDVKKKWVADMVELLEEQLK